MARTSSIASSSSTTRVMIRAAPGVAGMLVAVGAGRLEAVVPVGDHQHGAARPAARTASSAARSVEDGERVRGPARVGRGGDRWRVGHEVGEPRRERQAPDGVEVGPGGAQEREAVAACLRQGALVREDVAVAGAGSASAPSTPRVRRVVPAAPAKCIS